MDARAGEKMDERFEWKIERWGTDEGTLGRMYEIAPPLGHLEALTEGGCHPYPYCEALRFTSFPCTFVAEL